LTQTLLALQLRRASDVSYGKFHAKNLKFVPTPSPKPIPEDISGLAIGSIETDHMLQIDYTNGEWQAPVIRPVEPLTIHPLAKVLHYCPTIFEGLKAFRGVDNKIRMFRPEMNMARLRRSARRAALPDFCPLQLEQMIKDLVRIEQAWVPKGEGNSLYIRPNLFGTDASLGVARPLEAKLVVTCSPFGPIYGSGWNPIKLFANPKHIRAAPGGVGSFKMGCNYAPTVAITDKAAAYTAQCLWLSGEQQWITEAGAFNLFLYWKNTKGELELITPPTTDGLILPGITRDSILTLVKEWGEFKITERYPTMKEVKEAVAEGRVIEFFGVGTAVVVVPVSQIVYQEKAGESSVVIDFPEPTDTMPLSKRVHETITGIQ
ncbi:hypothetical protein PMAYCL1PPCAC_17316, partial [Pristionchus mayeri]